MRDVQQFPMPISDRASQLWARSRVAVIAKDQNSYPVRIAWGKGVRIVLFALYLGVISNEN